MNTTSDDERARHLGRTVTDAEIMHDRMAQQPARPHGQTPRDPIPPIPSRVLGGMQDEMAVDRAPALGRTTIQVNNEVWEARTAGEEDTKIAGLKQNQEAFNRQAARHFETHPTTTGLSARKLGPASQETSPSSKPQRTGELIPNGLQQKVHRLKSVSPSFEDVRGGYKKFEVRRADRDFQKGDYIVFNHYSNYTDAGYTGRDPAFAEIDYVMPSGMGCMPEGYCGLGIRKISDPLVLEYLGINPENEEAWLSKRIDASIKDAFSETEPTTVYKGLTNHERELLAHLAQEAGEVVKAVTKMMIFGKLATDPSTGRHYDNACKLSMECGNLLHMMHVCEAAGLIAHEPIQVGVKQKQEGLQKYLHKS